MRISIDIETAVYDLLTAAGYSASAHAIPATLGQELPHVHVTRTGGFTTDRVLDSNSVDLDVYAETQADAMESATALTGWVRALEGGTIGGVPCYEAEISTLPYRNPDPRHPNIGRATFKAQITIRTQEVDNA
jgi:hypothetical protein